MALPEIPKHYTKLTRVDVQRDSQRQRRRRRRRVNDVRRKLKRIRRRIRRRIRDETEPKRRLRTDATTNTAAASSTQENPESTESKSLLKGNSPKYENLTNQPSDCSVICLGSFRKIPQFVTLDDNGDEQFVDAVNPLETGKAPKQEKARVQK